ncbi:colicin E3/pyocin S6 family cytotoxin [Klebsiella pneumoniae]|nr:colicin E3/pyocin S6 family cytotoxin [Klebsiella pneumoniae]
MYEWDSQHGELEGYRASDGEHPGHSIQNG